MSFILSVVIMLSTTVCAYADNNSPAKAEVSVSGIADANVLDIAGITTLASNDSEIITLKATDITDVSVNLKWTDSTKHKLYTVFKLDTKAGIYKFYSATNKKQLCVPNLNASTSYSFAVAPAGNSNYTTVSFKTKPRRPKLQVKEISSNNIKLAVSNTTKNSKIDIYRGTDANKLKKIATIKNQSIYTDNGLKSKNKYYYQVKAVTSDKDNASIVTNSKTVSAKTPVKMGLPAVSGKTKTYAYYTAVTVKSSPQYKLLNSSKCYTDPKTGIRMVDGCYCIALGSYYGSKIGTKYKITLSTGKSFMAILCDQKADRHTDSNHQYAVRNKDILEFYVQRNKIPKGINGSYGNLEQFKGSVVSIEKFV